jgi:drug/metabolite transporter (DMT)-like permease
VDDLATVSRPVVEPSRAQPVLTADANAAPVRPSPRVMGVAMLLLAALLWSVSGVAVKVARMDPIAFAFYRSLAAAATMLVLVPLGRRLGRAPVARWAIPSVLVYTAVVSLLIISMTASTAATGILLQYTGPVFVALFAWLFQGRRIGRRTLAVMTLATAGIAVMIIGSWNPSNWVGPTAGLASGVAFGALVLILEQNNRAAPGGRVNPFALVFLNNAGAALLMLPVCVATGVLAATPTQLAIVLATGAIQLAVPYALFQLALRTVRPVDASLLSLLEPVLNPVWVAVFTSERPDVPTLIGGAAILVAMVVEATKLTSGREAEGDSPS